MRGMALEQPHSVSKRVRTHNYTSLAYYLAVGPRLKRRDTSCGNRIEHGNSLDVEENSFSFKYSFMNQKLLPVRTLQFDISNATPQDRG